MIFLIFLNWKGIMPLKSKKAQRKYYLENRDRALQYGRDYYSKFGKTLLLKLWHKEGNHLLKVFAVMAYSNPNGVTVCNNCGEQDIDVLCLDHIQGDGYVQRKEIRKLGSGMYQWLKKNNYPQGFQVLCYNCNMKKSRIDRSRNEN